MSVGRMNKTRAGADKPRASIFGGLLESVFGIYLCWGVGGALGISIALISSGVEVLGMPSWAWWFPVICAAAMAWFSFLARKAGQAQEIRPFVRNCVALLGMFAALCLLLGAAERGAFQDGGGPNGLNLGEILGKVRQIVAWGTLVVGPVVAFFGAGFVVLGLRPPGAGIASDGWQPSDEWKAKPIQQLRLDETWEQRVARQRAVRTTEASTRSHG